MADGGEFNRLRTFIHCAAPVGADAESNRFRGIQTGVPDSDVNDFGAQSASGLHRLLLHAARAGEETASDRKRACFLLRARSAGRGAIHHLSRMRSARL